MATFYEMLQKTDRAPARADNPFREAFAGNFSDTERTQRLTELFLAMAKGGPEGDACANKFRSFRECARNVCETLKDALENTSGNKMTAAAAGYLDACKDTVKEMGVLKDACAAAKAEAVEASDALARCFRDTGDDEARAFGMELAASEKTPFYQVIVDLKTPPSRRADLIAAIFVASAVSRLERDWRLLEFGQFVDVLQGAGRQMDERIACPATTAPEHADRLKNEFHTCERMIEFCNILKDGCTRAGADFGGDTGPLEKLHGEFTGRRQRVRKLWQLVAGSQKDPAPEDKIPVFRPLQLKSGA